MSRTRLGEVTDKGTEITCIGNTPYILANAEINNIREYNIGTNSWSLKDITENRVAISLSSNNEDTKLNFLSPENAGWLYQESNGAVIKIDDLKYAIFKKDPQGYSLNSAGDIHWFEVNSGIVPAKITPNKKASGIVVSIDNDNNDMLYAIDPNSHKVYKGIITSRSTVTWDAAPLPGTRNITKIVANKLFMCAIDDANNVCIHNGNDWEIMTVYGLAKEIALDEKSTLYMIGMDDCIYRL